MWGTECAQIEGLQKKAMRLITNSSYIAHTTPLFVEEKLLKVQEIFKLKLLNFIISYAIIYYRLILIVIVMSLIENLHVHYASILYINL